MAFYKNMRIQQENVDTGQYQVTVLDRINNRPIENAKVRISYTGAPDSVIEEDGDRFFGTDAGDRTEDAAAGIQYGTGGAAALCGIYGADRGGRF